MKVLRIISFILLVLLGIFLFVFGGYDDSPGAQGLGSVMMLLGLWRLFKIAKGNKTQK